MSTSSSSAGVSTHWLRSTLLSALGLVPLGACRDSISNSSVATPNANRTQSAAAQTQPSVAAGLTLQVTDDSLLPDSEDDEAGGTTLLHGYRFCNSHTPVRGLPGWFECDSEMRHRAKAKSCPSELPRQQPEAARDVDSSCSSDDDCNEGPHGYCAPYFPTSTTRECHYGCTVDAECNANELCFCGSPVGQCKEANCRTDAECGGRALCAIAEQKSAEPFDVFVVACQVPAHDQCGGPKDCGGGQMCIKADTPGMLAGYVPEDLEAVGARFCTTTDLPEGRPFLIDGDTRTAHAVERNDWRGEPGPALEPAHGALSAEQRRALHAAWLQRALNEHASIAAFSRFSLQLLQLGAPADLLVHTQRATLDEIAHAQSCFAQASRFAGHALGPSALDVEGATLQMHCLEIVEGTIVEGCIAETLAALEAFEAAHHARDGQVKATLERIARDEARHAALAWRFVAWVLADANAGTRSFVAELLETLLPEQTQRATPLPALESSPLTDFGVLPEPYRHALSAQGLRDVIAPCARALLGSVLGLGLTPMASSVSASLEPVAQRIPTPRA